MNLVFQRSLSTAVRSFALLPKHNYCQFSSSIKRNFTVQLKPADQRFSIFTHFQRKIMSSASESNKPKIVFVLGAPGSGKGTQCSKIVDAYNYVHLSAGDLLRAERNRPGSELAQMIEENIQAGRIIPVAVTCSLLEKAMTDQMKDDPTKNKFLIDGFPRNQDNLDGWIKQMEEKVVLQFVLFFECSDAVCIDRCLSRKSGRIDDNIDSLKKRFKVFYSETMPIVDHYDRLSLVRRVNSEKPADLVFEDVRQAFADFDAK